MREAKRVRWFVIGSVYAKVIRSASTKSDDA